MLSPVEPNSPKNHDEIIEIQSREMDLVFSYQIV